MPNDEDEVRPKPALVAQPPLDRLGLAELQAYIAALRAEIGRAEAEVARKASHRNAADSLFRQQ